MTQVTKGLGNAFKSQQLSLGSKLHQRQKRTTKCVLKMFQRDFYAPTNFDLNLNGSI